MERKGAKPLIVAPAGAELTAEEIALFAAEQPLGFILFARNIQSPPQLIRLTRQLRAAVGRDNAPILVDQEGGRVNRFSDETFWPQFPEVAHFGNMVEKKGIEAAEEATRENFARIGRMLYAVGIDVNCAPCLDLPQPGADEVIGKRAFSSDPDIAARLGKAAMEGLISAGVAPVIKHMPGHGRANVDSHKSLPVVNTGRDILEKHDFAPFKALAKTAQWGMSAHIRFVDIDNAHPATQSARVINEVIRKAIGFEGILVSDDLSMEALDGDILTRAKAALNAGCDLALHCNGDINEMRKLFAGIPPMGPDTKKRIDKVIRKKPAGQDHAFVG